VICADCKRHINMPALTIGRFHFGPVCAKRYIVAPTRTLQPVPMRLPRPRPVVDESQLTLGLEFA
jgi:hypothetical protein